MPQLLKQKSSIFIESDVEGDWVHQVKRPQLDKGKGQMDMVFSDLEDEDAWAQYWADIHQFAGASEMIACSFEALVTLLLDWLPATRLENWESLRSEEDAEMVNGEE